MKLRFLRATLPCVLMLVACGGDGPEVTVPEAPAGVHVVATGDEQAPATGYYHVGDDGTATLSIEDPSSAKVTRLYRRDGHGAWRSVPAATKDAEVSFLERRGDATVIGTLAELAGRYATAVSDSTVAVFDITPEGRVTPASGSTCRIEGEVLVATPPGTFRVDLTASRCAGVPSRLTGTLVSNAAWVAQKFRLFLEGDNTVQDWWAYPD